MRIICPFTSGQPGPDLNKHTMFLFLQIVILTYYSPSTFTTTTTSSSSSSSCTSWNFTFSLSCLCLVSHLDKLINLLAGPAHISRYLTGTPDQIIRFHKLQKIILLPALHSSLHCSLQTNFTLECLKRPKSPLLVSGSVIFHA